VSSSQSAVRSVMGRVSHVAERFGPAAPARRRPVLWSAQSRTHSGWS